MLIVRVFTAAARPALAGGTLIAAATGGWFAFDHYRGGPVSAFQQVQGHGQQLVVSEFGDSTDTVVVVNPADVSSRKVIATIDHAPGYGVFPSLAPDGRAIAYTALPSDAAKPSPDSPATAAIVDVDEHVTVLADDVDLLVTPVWSPDSSAVVVRKNTPAPDSAGTFEFWPEGQTGRTYRIESSTDLVNWGSVLTNTLASNSWHVLLPATNTPGSFYRGVWSP